MRSFVHRKNLENYRKQLAETNDEVMRLRLEKLLAEEEASEPSAPWKQDEDRRSD
jgi:hypothetical protein